MTIKHHEDIQDCQSEPLTRKGGKSMPIRRDRWRYTLPLATLTLASSAVPLFSVAASAAQDPISPQSTAPVVSYGDGLASVVVDSIHDVVLFTEPSGATSWTMSTVAKTKAGAEVHQSRNRLGR